MTRAENWDLVLRICDETNDEVIRSLRIALLNDFGKVEEFSKGANVKNLVKCALSFSPQRARKMVFAVPQDLPLILVPAASGSNLLNLLPVACEAQRRRLLGGMVVGDHVEKSSPTVLAEFPHVITERTLRSWVGITFLPSSFRRARRRLIDLIEQVNRYHPQAARILRRNYGFLISLMVKSERMAVAFRRLFGSLKPSCVLTTSDFWPFEFQCCWQAKKLGIPTAILQHGVLSDVSLWPTNADTFLAWGDDYRDDLLGRGASPERIAVTGMPASDELFLKSRPKSKTDDGSPVCLVLSHTQDRIEEAALFHEFADLLVQAVRALPEVKWRIKLHPAEDDSFYRVGELSRMPQVAVLPPDTSLEQAVRESDVVCTIRSTAGLQAMMMQRPVIVLNLPSLSTPPRWPLDGGGLYAPTLDTFKNHLNRLICEDDFRLVLLTSQDRFLDRTFSHKGQAAAAVVDFLANQASAEKRPKPRPAAIPR